jgi:hypothetical protein
LVVVVFVDALVLVETEVVVLESVAVTEVSVIVDADVTVYVVSVAAITLVVTEVVLESVVATAVSVAFDNSPPPQLQHASVASTPSTANAAKSPSLNRALWVLASHAPIST